MPSIFRYGKATPFYNVSNATRTVIFGTKNLVGVTFGILIAWIVISCMTLPLIQVWMRRESVQRLVEADTPERKIREQTDSA